MWWVPVIHVSLIEHYLLSRRFYHATEQFANQIFLDSENNYTRTYLPLTNTPTSSIMAQSSSPTMSELTQTGTTSWSISNSTSTVCECTCITPHFTPSNASQLLYSDLHVNKKRLSSYRRRFISIADDRFSAMVIGWSSGFILLIAVLMIILPDIVSVVKAARLIICCRRI